MLLIPLQIFYLPERLIPMRVRQVTVIRYQLQDFVYFPDAIRLSMMRKPFNMRLWIAVCITITLVSCGGDNEKILPKKQTITESVYASVIIQPDSLYEAYASVSGILEGKFVEEGDTVTKGSPLLRISNTTPSLTAENAALNLKLARENFSGDNAVLKNLRDEIESAALRAKNDSINYFRQLRLWEQQIGSKLEYENRKLAYEISARQLHSLENEYARTRSELATRVALAENSYRSANSNREDFTVRSEINGTVYAIYKEKGEIVTSMEPLASLGSSHSFLIEMQVDEVDIVRLRIGQRALISLDAYDDSVFEAQISKIYPKKDERSQTFKVEARFRQAPEALYPGLAGEGNIVIAAREGALTIPKSYLIPGDSVRTEQGLRSVEVGLENLEYVEIRSGIQEDTFILKPKP